MRRYCVRVCLFDGMTDSTELFGLLDCITRSGGIEKAWRSDGNIFIDIAAPAAFNDRASRDWANGYSESMVGAGYNAVAAPCQL